MLICPVCGTENDPLAVTCIQCRGFLQGRKDALDLFETLWGLVEAPRATFRRIVLARHKNYAVILSGIFGIAALFGIAWAGHLGNAVGRRVWLVLLGLLAGPPAGVLLIGLLALGMTAAARVAGARPSYRNMHAVAAYATMPVLGSLVLVFPVELSVFGFNLFGSNPHPMVINPVAYVVLLSLDAAAVLWWWILVWIGMAVAGSLTRIRAALATVLLLGTAAGAAALLLNL